MKNIGSAPVVVAPPSGINELEKSQQKRGSVIQIATDLVDSVTHMLCKQITDGHLGVDQHEKSLPIYRAQTLKIESKTLDVDEHRKKIRKFMLMNKKSRKKRQMKSLEMSERSIKVIEEEERTRQESKLKVIEERRKQIQKRMQAKKTMKKEIQLSVLEANKKYKSLRKKKFLYQEKEQQYFKRVILPQIQEQKSLLEKKKEIRKPIDMTQLFQHERKYEQLKINERLNRSITVRMIRDKDREYSPPEFIPESYKRVQEEEQLKRQEESLKKKQVQINDIRKREYSKRLEEIRLQERELSKSRSKSPPVQSETKEKLRPKLEREQVKNIGNQYLKQLLKSNRKFATTKKFKMTDQLEAPRRKVRSEYEIEIVKEERIQKIEKIRNKKIDSIVNDKKMDHHTKMQKLKLEINRLDDAADKKLKEKDDIETINQSASIMMNSIHAKLAFLGCNSP